MHLVHAYYFLKTFNALQRLNCYLQHLCPNNYHLILTSLGLTPDQT